MALDVGWTLFYLQRGARTDHEDVDELEPAFRHRLEQQLRSRLLPGQAEA